MSRQPLPYLNAIVPVSASIAGHEMRVYASIKSQLLSRHPSSDVFSAAAPPMLLLLPFAALRHILSIAFFRRYFHFFA